MPCTHKKTVEIVCQNGNNLLVQVKGNQPHLQQRLKAFTLQHVASDTLYTTDIGRRNRIEQRTTRVWPFPQHCFQLDSVWNAGKTLIEVHRQVDVFNTKTKEWQLREEKSVYFCTQTLTVEQAAHAVRQHWSIENRLHHVRDGSLKEDASRIRRNPASFARLRSWTLNLLRHNGEENIAQALFKNALSFDRLLNYQDLL